MWRAFAPLLVFVAILSEVAGIALPDLSACATFAVHTDEIRAPLSSTAVSLTGNGLLGAEFTTYASANPFVPARGLSPTSSACFNATLAALDAVFNATCDATVSVGSAQTYSGGGLRCVTGIWAAGTHIMDGLGDVNSMFVFRGSSLSFNAAQTQFINGAARERTFFFSNAQITTGVIASAIGQLGGTFVARTQGTYVWVNITGQLLTPMGATYVKFDQATPLVLNWDYAVAPPLVNASASSSTASIENAILSSSTGGAVGLSSSASSLSTADSPTASSSLSSSSTFVGQLAPSSSTGTSFVSVVTPTLLSTLPYQSACRPWAIHANGTVDFFISFDDPLPPAYFVRTLFSDALVAFSGNATEPVYYDALNPAGGYMNLARGTADGHGDFAPGVLFSPPSVSCLNATDASAILLDALPCEFYIPGGILVEYPGPTRLTQPGVYCPDNGGTTFSLTDGFLYLVGNETDGYIFKGSITISASSADAQIIPEGGLLLDNVIIRSALQLSDPFASNHVGSSFDQGAVQANITMITSISFAVAGNTAVGRILMTNRIPTDTSLPAVSFLGSKDMLLTANTTYMGGGIDSTLQPSSSSSSSAGSIVSTGGISGTGAISSTGSIGISIDGVSGSSSGISIDAASSTISVTSSSGTQASSGDAGHVESSSTGMVVVLSSSSSLSRDGEFETDSVSSSSSSTGLETESDFESSSPGSESSTGAQDDQNLPDGSTQRPFPIVAQTDVSIVVQLPNGVAVSFTNMRTLSDGNFSVTVSDRASNRSTSALLGGRVLKSPVFSFTFTPFNRSLQGIERATIAIDVSNMTVASGKVLQLYKFNEETIAWDHRGGTINSTAHLLEYTTTSFSDWSVQETDANSSSSDADVPYMPLWAWILASFGVLCLIVFVGTWFTYGSSSCRAKSKGYQPS